MEEANSLFMFLPKMTTHSPSLAYGRLQRSMKWSSIGDISVILSVDIEENLLQIKFDDRIVDYEFNELDEISLAYAISIQKAQGSEYPAVVIPLAMQHYMLLERNLLYTGVTRGKQLVVIIAQPKALVMAVKNQRSQRRVTNLISRLSTNG